VIGSTLIQKVKVKIPLPLSRALGSNLSDVPTFTPIRRTSGRSLEPSNKRCSFFRPAIESHFYHVASPSPTFLLQSLKGYKAQWLLYVPPALS
jgi:hypothetical protein